MAVKTCSRCGAHCDRDRCDCPPSCITNQLAELARCNCIDSPECIDMGDCPVHGKQAR